MQEVLTRHRASVVCVDQGALLCVRLRDPVTRLSRLFVPGGRIEAGELPVTAAERETLEETGYRVRADSRSELVARYPYRWGGQERAVTTHFFRAHLLSSRDAPAAIVDADYHEGACWLSLSRLREKLGFHEAIFRAVSALALAPR